MSDRQARYLALFVFMDAAATEIYTLSLHDALPILRFDLTRLLCGGSHHMKLAQADAPAVAAFRRARSEEHTSELQSPVHLVCRLLLEKKKNRTTDNYHHNILLMRDYLYIISEILSP